MAELADIRQGALAYLDSTDAETLNKLLEPQYHTWSDKLHPNYSEYARGYVLLVGDTDTIPGWASVSAGEVTDLRDETYFAVLHVKTARRQLAFDARPSDAIALAINQVCKAEAEKSKFKPRFPHIVADVVNHRKTQHLKDTSVNEIVCPTDYGIGLLAQSAVNPGLVQVYDQLLRFTSDENELYMLDSGELPQELTPGKATFKDIGSWLEEKSRPTENPVILLGFFRQGKPILNPQKEAATLAENDKLIVLSYCCPCLSDLSASG